MAERAPKKAVAKKAAPAAKAVAKKAAPAAKAVAKKAAPAAKAVAKKAAPAAKKAASAVKAVAKKAAPAGKVARAVAKVSPLAGMAIDAYVKAKASGWQGEAVHKLAALVREIAPNAEVAIKWGQPVFSENGPMAFVRASKNHVTLGFWRGADMTDKDGVLEGAGDRMKHLKIGSLAEVRAELVRPFLEEAVRLNREKGDPTRRR